ncbi:hypothetical protein [Polyangium sorediatum]|uniref:PEGA domain-containing protein n=1 Tax=Polyangium sorediatum TaxID=889274 RepID=A0ABT6NUQ0_9BACT|nr:hypothetical protein [Polyangium sorediatum]MDI1432072.1 hypothetical protein [Polyangium sorediatum]
MKHLLLASTLLLAVSVSSSVSLAEEGAGAPAPTEPIQVPEKLEIPYTVYTTDRALMTTFHESTRKLLLEAQALEKAGKVAAALEKYQDAYAHNSLPDTQLELGLAQARAGLFLPCARNIQDVIAFWALRDYKLHPVTEVRTVLAYCAKRLGTIALRINIAGVRITVDGELVMDWPYHDEIYVEPGGHEIKANASGYWMNETHVDIKAGERKELRIAMQQRIHAQYVQFPTPPIHFNINANLSNGAKGDQPTWPRNLMIGSGVGLAFGLGGLVTGLIMNVNAPDDGTVTTGKGLAYAGGILSALSVGGLVIGLASRPEPPPPNVIITPQIAKDGGGVQFTATTP